MPVGALGEGEMEIFNRVWLIPGNWRNIMKAFLLVAIELKNLYWLNRIRNPLL